MKLMEIVHGIIEDLKKQGRYTPENFAEENLYETYILLAELLNPDDSYPYTGSNGWYKYKDMMGNYYDVRLLFQPFKGGYYELKTWWSDESGKKYYDQVPQSSTGKDWDKRSNTVAKIFRDEIIPIFKKQDLSLILKFVPLDKQRYYFSLRMIKKFIPKEWKIIENFPTEIMIEKE